MENRHSLLLVVVAVTSFVSAAYAVMSWAGMDLVSSLTIEGMLSLMGGGLLLDAQERLRERTSTRRANAGMCIICGYDLRATPNKCPECGAIASAIGNR